MSTYRPQQSNILPRRLVIERKFSPENHEAASALAAHQMGGSSELSWIAGAQLIVICLVAPADPEQERSGL
jgi:hypothetical protein